MVKEKKMEFEKHFQALMEHQANSVDAEVISRMGGGLYTLLVP